MKSLLSLLKVLAFIVTTIFTIIFLFVGIRRLTQEEPAVLGSVISFIVTILAAFAAYKCLQALKPKQPTAQSEMPSDLQSHDSNRYSYDRFRSSESANHIGASDDSDEQFDDDLEESIEYELELIEDCIGIIKTSSNLKLVMSRLKLGAERVAILQQLIQSSAQIYPDTDHAIDFFLYKKAEWINYCLNKAYLEMLSEANQLSSAKSKVEKYKEFIDEIHKYDAEYNVDNREYIRKIEEELHSLIHRTFDVV